MWEAVAVTSDPRPLIRTQITDVTRKSSSLTTTATTTTRVLTLLNNCSYSVQIWRFYDNCVTFKNHPCYSYCCNSVCVCQ